MSTLRRRFSGSPGRRHNMVLRLGTQPTKVPVGGAVGMLSTRQLSLLLLQYLLTGSPLSAVGRGNGTCQNYTCACSSTNSPKDRWCLPVYMDYSLFDILGGNLPRVSLHFLTLLGSNIYMNLSIDGQMYKNLRVCQRSLLSRVLFWYFELLDAYFVPS